MSKTIRRKQAIKYDPYNQGWFKDTIWLRSKYGGRYQYDIKCDEKELKKRVAKYHSDHFFKCNIGNTPRYFRRNEHRTHRMNVKEEFAKYFKNNEYEIQIRANPRWDWWD
jgi:hypothetical protein